MTIQPRATRRRRLVDDPGCSFPRRGNRVSARARRLILSLSSSGRFARSTATFGCHRSSGTSPVLDPLYLLVEVLVREVVIRALCHFGHLSLELGVGVHLGPGGEGSV